MEGAGKRLIVLGAGESGVGTAILSKKQGWDVFVSDLGTISEEYKSELVKYEIRWEEGKHTEEEIFNADLVVKSPGIPDKVKTIQHFHANNIPVISEIEFAGYYNKAKTVCITGSNGKTTTTMLTYHTFKKAGLNVGLAGNVGKSFAKQVAEEDFDWYILELSSFQLDGMFTFKADISILLNISPDHLDRYEYKMDNYVQSKFRIIQNQSENEYFIYNADDELVVNEIEKRSLAINMLPFSLKKVLEKGAYLNENQLIINIKDPLVMSIHDLALKGKHNAQNSLASGIASRLVEIRKEVVRDSFSDFVNVEHRLEFVAKVHGITFINDSKATNVNSTWFALESMDAPTVWIVGGVDKGNDYSELLDLVKEKVKAIICLGNENKKIIDTFTGVVETIVEAGSAMEAVSLGYRLAKKDETVLLSPACASFDLFENYEDRGDQFKACVRAL
ncbi:MAG: UDP-N-acetylmuramoyl-L-alanine--D-glutamate ligase [Crocinitomicaceae bacterium]|jgi:UDP-N-acetylmuramoylalanine--D-glutamate ligase